MDKICNNADKFFKAGKNKIMLGSVFYMLACCIVYFAASGDKVSMKGLMAFLTPAVFAGVFYGIKFILRIRNRFAPTGRSAGFVFDMLCVLAALAVSGAFLYDFILTFDGANLVILSAASALFNAVICARVKNTDARKEKRQKK